MLKQFTEQYKHQDEFGKPSNSHIVNYTITMENNKVVRVLNANDHSVEEKSQMFVYFSKKHNK